MNDASSKITLKRAPIKSFFFFDNAPISHDCLQTILNRYILFFAVVNFGTLSTLKVTCGTIQQQALRAREEIEGGAIPTNDVGLRSRC